MLPIILFLLLAQSIEVESVPNPRSINEWVTDQANVIEPTARDRLNSRIDSLNQEIGVEIAIVTVPTVPGVPHDFALELFNHWGIGSAETNNGFLIFLALEQRRLETITGIGLENVLTDSWLKEMQDREMVPLFRSGMFGSGLEAGMKAVEEHLRSAPGEMPEESQETPAPALDQLSAEPIPEPTPPGSGSESNYGWLLWIIGGGSLVGGTWVGNKKFQAYRRRCPTCKVQMLHLDEVADDEHLERGQRKEEELGSVDYNVYICPACQDSRIVPNQKWFSGYIKCPNCNHKTNKKTTKTLVVATTTHGGKVEVQEKCEHCKHRTSGIRHTAKRTATRTISSSSRSSFGSSSFGSSSGSSFGGGSSRGGGAGSSW